MSGILTKKVSRYLTCNYKVYVNINFTSVFIEFISVEFISIKNTSFSLMPLICITCYSYYVKYYINIPYVYRHG